MIQGQFDAAAKLGVTEPHNPAEDGEREQAERPSKRRRVSPPIKDSINVVAITESQQLKPPHRRGSLVTAKPDDEQVSAAEDNDTDTATSSQDTTSSQPTHRSELGDSEQEDVGRENPPLNSEQAPFLDNSYSTESLPHPNISDHTINVKIEVEAPGPPPNAKDFENESRRNAQSAPVAVSSTTSSRSQSPTTAPSSQPPRTRLFRLPNGSRILHPLSPCQNASSGPSTPKPSQSSTQTNTTSSPLSSPPPELFDPYDEQSTAPPSASSRPSSPVSDDEGQSNSSDEGGPSMFQERLHRSQTLRRSLSTLKGRELFDASIWSDPLKTSVFYTFATNLRQKSKDAAPTGCHEFISHLSNAGKMVRCYTQNIDLLEDKVGLSTRLLLGPGSRSRFSTRLSKGATGTATPRSIDVTSSSLSNAADGPCISSQMLAASEQTEKEESKQPTAASLTNSQEASSLPTVNAEPCEPKISPARLEKIEDARELGQDSIQDQCQAGDADKTTAGTQPVEAALNSLKQPASKPASGRSMPEPNRGVECVFLHGSLRSLRCFQCGSVADWDEGNREHLTMSGEQPPCPRCEDATAARQERGKRALGVGKLRPDIVLYGEEHPESQRIATIIQHDISLAPDMLIIMGTSLKVHGLKTVVREFAKAVHNKKDGKVIFINFTKPAESVWADIIDFWVQMDCDAWVQDLKKKKPVIWLPPGSFDDEPRIKRRRTIKDESDKKPSKKTKHIEQLKDKAHSARTPDQKEKKKPSTAPVREELSDVKKPEPKRPAAFRDCKHNGAYWTSRIMSELAKLSGRKDELFVSPPSSKPTAAPPDNVSAVILDDLVTRKTTHFQQSAKSRRGPRTKNTKSRKMRPPTSPTPKAKKKPQGKIANSIMPIVGKPDVSTAEIQPEGSEVSSSNVSVCSSLPVAATNSDSIAVHVTSGEASCAMISAEAPIPNLGSETGLAGPGTSILASVKSNHRVRKPKRIFGEPESKMPSISSGGNSKAKPKNSSQTKKAKSSAKPNENNEAQGEEVKANGTVHSRDVVHNLPSLPPRLQPMSTAPQLATPQREETPVESYNVLPPLQHASIGRQPKHDLPAIGVGSVSVTSTAHPPPDVLEPIIIPGPPVAISPTTLSPNHWRDRAFTFYGDPLSRHFQYPYRPGGPPQSANGPPMQPSMHSHQSHRPGATDAVDFPSLSDGKHAVSDASQLGAAVPLGFDDSPSQQLHRESQESRETEAAAALYDLRGQPGYDSRQFAIKPEGM